MLEHGQQQQQQQQEGRVERRGLTSGMGSNLCLRSKSIAPHNTCQEIASCVDTCNTDSITALSFPCAVRVSRDIAPSFSAAYVIVFAR